VLPAFRVDREACAKLPDLRANADFRRAGIAGLRRERMQSLDDAPPNGLKLILSEAARRCRRRTKTNARRDGRLFRVERNSILVAGDAGSFEALLGIAAGDPH